MRAFWGHPGHLHSLLCGRVTATRHLTRSPEGLGLTSAPGLSFHPPSQAAGLRPAGELAVSGLPHEPSAAPRDHFPQPLLTASPASGAPDVHLCQWLRACT